MMDDRFTREYNHYHYHGREFNHYVPRYTYIPAFYGWAYYPWDSPAAYMWGWMSSAWFACNAGYFDPSGSYQSGADWLSDYYLSQTLSDSFDGELRPVQPVAKPVAGRQQMQTHPAAICSRPTTTLLPRPIRPSPRMSSR